MKTLGIIGGLGPMATAYFMEVIISMTQAGNDSEHIPMLVYNYPGIPDRTQFILGNCDRSPYPDLVKIGSILKEYCDCIALPCVTAHYFHERLQSELGIHVFNMPEETAECLKAAGVTCAGLMATDGTIAGGCFKKALDDKGIEMVVPKENSQKKIMSIIYDGVKAGGYIDIDSFNETALELRENGAQVIILGCTELSILKGRHNIGAGYIDVLEAAAAAIINECGAVLKPEYRELISK